MKKVTWDAPQLQNKNSPYLKNTKTFKELWKAGQELEREQAEAQDQLMKAMPAMVALLEYKLKNREPLVVMRPLRYQTSEIIKGDAIDDAFYRGNSQNQKVNDKFTDVIKTILPGTQLILKALDTALMEFIFEDALGNEHALNFSERDNLMTQTNVYEEVRNYLGTRGE